MDMETMAIQLTEVDGRSKRNEGRIKELERETESIHELAKSTAVMASELQTMNQNVRMLTGKVDALEQKPAKRWEQVVEKVVLVIVAALVGMALARLGITT